MVSKFAIAEIEDMRDEGYNLTLEQIITLNALGCAVEYAQPGVLSSPRFVQIGGVTLHELTIQAQQWYRDYAGRWWEGESLVIALAWANCNARKPGFFKPWTNERVTRMRIVAWFRSLNCTPTEFDVAFDYVNRSDALRSVPDDDHSDDEFYVPPTDRPDALHDIVVECLSVAGLALSESEIVTKTRAEINDILIRWSRNQIAAHGSSDRLVKELKSSAESKFYKYVDWVKKCLKTA